MTAWLAQYFFNPAFVLPGAALIASPIIIHLINRMRFRRVRFAAMEFLLQSQQRNRRRLLLEQMLLLLLRILIVVGLVALIARLIIDPSQLSVFQGVRAHHVVLLDDSGSMRDRHGESTAFADALEVIRKLVDEGARRPGTQRFSLVVLSAPDRPVFTQRDVNDAFVRELETRLEHLTCTHQSLDLLDGLEGAKRVLGTDAAAVRHLHVISDYRLADWSKQSAAGEAVAAIQESGTAVNLVRTVAERNENLAVTQLTGDVHVAAKGVPLRLDTAVANLGTQTVRNVRLAVVVDGNRLPLSVAIESIDPGQEVHANVDVTFDTPGKHELRVLLDDDALPQDNARFLAVNVADSTPVLIVDGNPLAKAAEFVADAIAADAGLTGLAPTIDGVDALRRRPLDPYSCIFLLNVPELAPDAVQRLDDYVSAGGGVAWFLGDAVKPAFYNSILNANGLFPAPLATARRELPHDEAKGDPPDLKLAEHPIFTIFSGQENPFVETVRVFSLLPVDEKWNRDDNARQDGVSTIARLRDGQPLVLEHTHGAGRVITFLSSADVSWNNWARNPSYVIVQLELQKYIAHRGKATADHIVGEPISISLDPATYIENIEIIAPETAVNHVTRLQAAPVEAAGSAGTAQPAAGQNLRLEAAFTDTDAPGVYAVRTFNHERMPEETWTTYNVPAGEGRMELAATRDIREQVGDDVRIQEEADFRWIEGRDAGQDVRWTLLVLLVAFLLAEQFLSYRLSYHPKIAGAAA